ncbi:hypothetical protein CKAN_00101000 [Cinnamomum micranthum f. kanehirae]|uniref:Uncharacterized protein n=1 Tax=Cinnamomum micranthum f. kanehirae TaxID=337451 RepID=A0A3S3LWD6_9MAGN|nr:hypothetical protein CKAN_00101000 [Cinnamomum micranthum f. kanehirae]
MTMVAHALGHQHPREFLNLQALLRQNSPRQPPQQPLDRQSWEERLKIAAGTARETALHIRKAFIIGIFGVVLVELITGQDPSSKAFNGRGRTSLAMEERLEEWLDHSIWAEERKEELLWRC